MEIKQDFQRYSGVLIAGVIGVVTVSSLQKWQQDRTRALALRHAQAAQPPLTLVSTPTVSVLVAAWNEAPIIEQHLEAFHHLRYPCKELILCAGGQDGTYAAALGWHTRMTDKGSDAGSVDASIAERDSIKILEQHPGEGKQHALQRCFEHASGELIFLTDADCLLDDRSFEATLAPLINLGEQVATGGSRPLDRQMDNPFVRQQWLIDLYTRASWGSYTGGLLGRNLALTRPALHDAGGFTADVRTGTDYHMAKMLLARGYHIRYAAASQVETTYAEDLASYHTQQTRWLRNVVTHGLTFGAYDEVARNLLPSAVAAWMLSGWFFSLLFPPLWLVWIGLWVQAVQNRMRYLRFGELLTGQSAGSYLLLPGYLVLDFATWASVWWQYPIREFRRRW